MRGYENSARGELVEPCVLCAFAVSPSFSPLVVVPPNSLALAHQADENLFEGALSSVQVLESNTELA